MFCCVEKPMGVLKGRVDKEGSKGLTTQLIEKLILSNPHRKDDVVQVVVIFNSSRCFGCEVYKC